MLGASKNIWGFDPRSVGGCVVWLDAADSNTLTLSGANITAWIDKSVLGNNVTSISATPPTFLSVDSSVNFTSASCNSLKGNLSSTYSNEATVFAVASVTPTPELSAGVVTTFAGNGTGSYVNGTGTNATFQYPSGVTVNGSGTVYISDTWNHRIRLITPLGVVSFLAGSGSPAFANGTGAGASFSYPAQIAVDINGNAYVADTNNQRIRKITSAGVVTTFAGSGTQSSTDGTGGSATFNTPVGLTISKDNTLLFVTEANGNRIRQIVISTAVVTTVAGNGTSGATDGTGTNATFGFPIGIAPDPFGNLYVSDPTAHRVRKIVIATGVVTTFAGSSLGTANGTGTNAQFNYPTGVTCDENGNVFVAEADTPRIRKITPGAVVTTFAGSGTATSVDGTGTNATFSKPRGIFYYTDGIIYVADEVGHRIRKMNTKTVNLTFPQVSSLGSNAATENNLIGQAFEMQGVTPNLLTFVETSTNPTGLGSNIQTYLSNTLLDSKLILTNTSTYSDTTFGITSFLNGSNQTFSSITSTLATNSSNVNTYNKYSIGGFLNATATVATSFNGKLFEYLVFNNALTTAQRQQIEGYLAWKWGISSSSIPSTHPFYSIKPHLRIFQPSDFSDLSVWFDASDTSTITGTSTVTAWKDKSTNTWNATTLIGTAPTNTTVNGLNAVSFAGSSVLTVSNVAFSSVQSRAIFVVYRVPTSTPNYISWFSTQSPSVNNQGGHNNLVYPSGSGGPFLQSYAVGGAVQYISTDVAPSTIGTTAQCAMIHSAFSATSNVVTLNGTSYLLSLSMIASGYSTSTVTYYIGNSYPQPYILCEYIMYQREFTQSERQIVEGYLANKWGITSTLPSTHPFKTFPASASLPFLPTNVSGCQLWLDAADSSSMTFSSGSNISQWRDKSGLGNHATGVNSPVLTANSINKYQAIVSTNNQYFTGSTSITGTTVTIFAVAQTSRSLPNSGSDQRLVSLANGANVDYGRADGVIGLFNRGSSSTISTYRLASVAENAITANTAFQAVSKYNGTNGYLWKDGTAGSTPSSASSGTFSVTKYGIGNQANPSAEYWIGSIGEVIIYNVALSDTIRQQIEGYLADKWGLQRSLPNTHSFYKFSPSFNLFSNRFTAPETIVKSGGTTYHVFISTGTFTTTTRTVNYLFVGGGGGGGDRHGGGGGAGGVQSGTWSASAGSYTVTVGAGGDGGNYEYNNSTPRGSGLKGGDTTISGVNTAYGGGGGGTYDGNPTGTVGSGGGGGFNLAGISGTVGQGNSGGAGGNPAGGGGGGAGGTGVAANTGTGGVGTTSYSATLLAVGYGTAFAIPVQPNRVILNGVAYIAGGGGGPSGASPGPGGLGGLGGGGRGDWDNNFISTGTPNTGGGGGGTRSESGGSSAGAPGGSGLVILWY